MKGASAALIIGVLSCLAFAPNSLESRKDASRAMTDVTLPAEELLACTL